MVLLPVMPSIRPSVRLSTRSTFEAMPAASQTFSAASEALRVASEDPFEPSLLCSSSSPAGPLPNTYQTDMGFNFNEAS